MKKIVYLLLGGGESDMKDRFSAIVNAIRQNNGDNECIIATGFQQETDFYKDLYNKYKLAIELIAVSSYDTESNASSVKSNLEGADKVVVASGAKHLDRFKKCLADAGIDYSNFEFISDECTDVRYENILTIIYKFKLGRKLFQYFAYVLRIKIKHMM